MKTKIPFTLCFILLPLAFSLSAFAQGTAFTYQGRLNSAGVPANGLYDFRFKLYFDPLGNTQAGSSFVTNAIPTTNGLFTVAIDFGAGIFTGSNYWLEVDVKTNNAGSYTVLNPLQAVTPAPYAIFANTASNLSGTLPAAQLSGPIANGNLPASPAFSGTVAAGAFSGDGSALINLNAAQLSSGTVPLPQLPAAVLTNNESSVVTFGNSLTLGNPTVYMPNGSTLLLATTNYDLLIAPGLSGKRFTGPRWNTALGFDALSNNIDGTDNTAMGLQTLFNNTNGVNNTAMGSGALFGNKYGRLNTGVGYAALEFAPGGTNDIALGFLAGSAFQGIESGNIDIGNIGVFGENNIIRIGDPGTQTNAFIAGVINGNGGGLTNLNAAQINGTFSSLSVNGTVDAAVFNGGTLLVGSSGTTITNLEAGQAIMPPSSLQETNFTITFPHAFTAVPKVIASIAFGIQGVNDVYAIDVSSNSTTAFRVNVMRLDTAGGWGQDLLINWQAWQ